MSISISNQFSQSSIYTSLPQKPNSSESAKEHEPLFGISNDLIAEKKEGMERILERVENDKDFAKEMVNVYTTIPDRPIVNLEKAFDSPGGLAALQAERDQFDVEAKKVSEQRKELYSSLSAKNYSDAEIFKALRDFNDSLPTGYKQLIGIAKVDTRA